jgi:hypothetical protein
LNRQHRRAKGDGFSAGVILGKIKRPDWIPVSDQASKKTPAINRA